MTEDKISAENSLTCWL